MKISKEQWEKIEEINERVKGLDPVLKTRIVDIELRNLFGMEYIELTSGQSHDDKRKLSQTMTNESRLAEGEIARSESIPTIKDFYAEKRPGTAIETVTVFGFYLEHYLKKDEFTETDISRAYYEARARKPKVIGQALIDARNVRGYLVEGSKRGRYRLSNTGENLVLHDLPKRDDPDKSQNQP